jgi:hypothetical protein
MSEFCTQGKKRKGYAFWRQFDEKPSVIPGCPGSACNTAHDLHFEKQFAEPEHLSKTNHPVCPFSAVEV